MILGFNAFSNALRRTPQITRIIPSSSRLRCIGTQFTPVPPSDAESENELFVHSPATTIVPVAKQLPLPRPSLITFDAYGTLIVPSQSVGRWYREVLNSACDMRIRLPRPKLFTAAFTKAYADRAKAHPCFGATSGMTAREWWFEVVRQTYLSTESLTTLDREEIESLLPQVFEELYVNVFSSADGWSVSEDALYVLDKLRGWRDQGAGPRLGVLSNFDDRLPTILKELGLLAYFDLVVTSQETRAEKPDRAIFDAALARAAAGAVPVSAATAYHVGDSLERDVAGAVGAGWTAMRFRPWFDEDLPDWSSVESETQADEGAAKRQALMLWGRKDTASGLDWVELWGLDDILTVFGFPDDDTKPVRTTYIRGYLDD